MSRRPTVVLVEDDPLLRRTLSTFLSLSFEAIPLADGEELGEIVGSTGAELVMLDVGLPGRDGVSLCREIANRYPQVPILFLTARGDDATYERCVSAGAWAYVSKPVDLKELFETVDRLIH